MSTTLQIQPNKAYSAREALQFVKHIFASENKFRDFLREDIVTNNLFNAKMYKVHKLTRFIIQGSDLHRAIQAYDNDKNKRR